MAAKFRLSFFTLLRLLASFTFTRLAKSFKFYKTTIYKLLSVYLQSL